MPRYNPATIEPKWQAYWDEHASFSAPRLPSGDGGKLYVLDMFPYPSGNGLHVGHPEGYTATDIICRAARMQGKSVVHPMGFDSFGLPAEEHAIKTGTHPRVQTEANIENFRRQLKNLGFSYDWDRELATTDVDYFRWTQWIFLQIYDTWFDEDMQRGRPIAELPIPDDVRLEGDAAVARYQDEHRLAYQSEASVNWCPALGTVLANEEVQGGKSERGSHPVVRIPLRQWKLRITAYADRLEKDLDGLDWAHSIKLLQRNWIGRSEGVEVDFVVRLASEELASGERKSIETQQPKFRPAHAPRSPAEDVLRVYTTRPDTLFGATYMVIAPEHPFVLRLTMPEQCAEVTAYREMAAAKSDLDRTDLAKEKTGVFTGSYAINPTSGERIPIWVADYVLISYGTGAIMAVPAHDERDFEFAEQFGIRITPVVDPGDAVTTDERDQVLAGKRCFVGDGVAVNSGEYDGLTTAEFKRKITTDLTEKGLGTAAVNYKLRDWLFSRQRFWGEPFPLLHELDDLGKPTGIVRAVDEADLPVDLPHLDDFKPHGRPEPPLDKAPDDWLYPVVDGVRYKRETNTMPQWAGSCWYYLRFLDPKNDTVVVDPEIERAWMPVDLYVGGAEHAVLHLLYARFWHKVLFDRGVVSTPEPFQKLVNQGMILGEPSFSVFYKTKTLEAVSGDQPLSIAPSFSKTNLQLAELIRNTPPDIDRAYDKETEDVSCITVDPTDLIDLTEGDSTRPSRYALRDRPRIIVRLSADKMSKSRGNVVNPDDVVEEYGADSLRLYEMFMGPLEATKPWNMDGVNGVFGFLGRVWRLIVDDRADVLRLSPAVVDTPPTEEELRELHKTIKKVTSDVESLSFNTAIARMMECTNFFTKREKRPREAMEKLVLLVSPFAPHVAEELWEALGHDETLAYEPWPEYDESLTRDAMIEVVAQINGKVRRKLSVPAGADQATLEATARSDERIAELLEGKNVIKTIVVPGRLVNFVVKKKDR